MADFLAKFGYPAIALVLLASGLGLPLPEDVPLLTGGWLCGTHLAHLRYMIPMCLICVLGGDSLTYAMGRRYGHLVPRLPILRSYLSPERLAQAQDMMQRYDGRTLFIARFLPGLRAPIFFSAGLCKVPFWRFLMFDGLAAIISVPTLILVAYYLSDHIEQVRHWTVKAQLSLAGAIVIGIASYVLIKRYRAKAKHDTPSRSTGSPVSPADPV
jgi:membrane protein DedA with SNARE-associated domain